VEQDERPVPVKTILVTIGLVLATLGVLYLVRVLARIEMLLLVAGIFAVVLTPLVELVHARAHIKRGLAAGLVFVGGIVVVGAMLFMIIKPLVTESRKFADNFPTYLSDAQKGRGALGGLVKRYDLEKRYEDNKAAIENAFKNAGSRAVSYIGKAFSGVVTMLTILVLSFMMLLYGPELTRSALAAVPPNRRERVRAVAADCSRAVTGYVSGNLLISFIAGVLTYIALWILGVPFKEVLALWVAFADLIPLVGATLGAIPTIAVAFLHSVPAGIGVVIFYIVYQQIENHFLQPVIMARTVQINQLFVLVSVLIGVELAGFVGAILAIPLAGVVAVIVRDLWDHRKGQMKEEPTIGEEAVPVTQAMDEDAARRDAAAQRAAEADAAAQRAAEAEAAADATTEPAVPAVSAQPGEPPAPPGPSPIPSSATPTIPGPGSPAATG
jgi:predicted PurR-regulated permease PerM